ncbi:3-keto-5-aminohexanoate cleavage protein [Bilifractor sp. LCP21S3_A7]|uniref:3-keto-5-aminohexanoate cleavage protein n=1 Tax=Bilifractor sp. LCP21S3_A7 TaxID=3438738 RepID=UPI003F8E8584
MKKVMISVAPVSNTENEIRPEAIAEDVYRSYLEGASMVHLHVRDAHGKLTADMTRLEETVEAIRSYKDCDIVIEISTGGVSDLTIQERCAPCFVDYSEALSLNVGSVNLGNAVYKNPIPDVEYCVQQILAHDKRPEIEVFELGMIHMVKELNEKYHFIRPILFALVFGNRGEMPATLPALRHMREYLYECFPERSDVLWGYTQANRRDFQMIREAVAMGADSLRVGFEDSCYLDPETRTDSNWKLIRKTASIIRENGQEPMTPSEVRSLLKIPG